MPESQMTYPKPRSKTPIVLGGVGVAAVALAAALNLFSTSNAEFADEQRATAARDAVLSERMALVEAKTEGVPGELADIRAEVAEVDKKVALIGQNVDALLEIAKKE